MGAKIESPGGLAFATQLSTVITVGVPAALAAVALWWLFLTMGLGRLRSTGLALGYGLATLCFPYATLFYGHQTTCALVVLGFVFLAQERRGTIELGVGGLIGVGALLGWAVIVEYPAALAVVVLGIYALGFVRPWGRLFWLGLGLALPGLLCAAYHWMVFGGPATLPYEFSTQGNRSQGFFMGLGAPVPRVMVELTVGAFRGLLYSAPWLWAALPGAWLLLRRRGWRAEAVVAISIVLLFFWLNTSLVDWQGGWAMGPRYLITAIPFLVVLAAGLLHPDALPTRWLSRSWAALVLVLALHSSYLMLAGTAVKPEVPIQIRRPYQRYLLPHFERGEVAISTQGIDMIGAPRGAPPKAWNLGQKLFGLHGRKSLLPLWIVQALCLAWLAWALARSKHLSLDRRRQIIATVRGPTQVAD
jgi:hypothetical protein